MPMSSYSSGCVKGSSTASLISWIWDSKPPTSAYDSRGAFSTCGEARRGRVRLGGVGKGVELAGVEAGHR